MWGPFAHDYLPIMASSVSSERAFSAAGITISKRCNRLKGDIVKALQFLKVMIHSDLIFREAPVSAKIEKEIEGIEVIDDEQSTADTVALCDAFTWDTL